MANDAVHPSRPRNIVILCDGTGKNGAVDLEQGEPITNVWRLYQAIKPEGDDLVQYFPGVGADNQKATVSDLLARTFGHTAVSSIRKIYMTIAQNYRDGDNLSLFGYSRGAFIVRKVASLIGALGLISNEAEFNKYWKGMEHKLPGKRSSPRPANPRHVPISCLGVWDTVGAIRPLVIRELLNLLTLPDNDLPEIVQSALHVIAYHENRKLFNVVLFDEQHKNQLFKQTCFPGCHSDVGGGAEEKILPDVTLDWMLRNMPKAIRVVLAEQLQSEIPKAYRINSAFHDSPSWKRIPDKLLQRENLTTVSGLLRHRTLMALESPESPHLLGHGWEAVDYPEEEVENIMPTAKPSIVRRLTQMVKPASMSAPRNHRAALTSPAPPLPPLPNQISSITESQLLASRRPNTLQFSRPDSASTQQTDATTHYSTSTARTSVISVELHSNSIEEDCKDDEPLARVDVPDPALPESEPKPVSPQPPFEQPVEVNLEPAAAKTEPTAEQVDSTTEKAVTQSAEKLAPTALPTTRLPQAQAAKPKKGLIRRIKGFFRKALCSGR